MMNKWEELVNILIEKKLEISTMESCTGGALANAITSVEGASEILKFSAVTYSNEYKIKMGVSEDIIKKYSVYSMETSKEMSNNISKFTSSDIGVGITGKLNRKDINNPFGSDNMIYISIYFFKEDKYYNYTLKATNQDRESNKQMIIDYIGNCLLKILKK